MHLRSADDASKIRNFLCDCTAAAPPEKPKFHFNPRTSKTWEIGPPQNAVGGHAHGTARRASASRDLCLATCGNDVSSDVRPVINILVQLFAFHAVFLHPRTVPRTRSGCKTALRYLFHIWRDSPIYVGYSGKQEPGQVV